MEDFEIVGLVTCIKELGHAADSSSSLGNSNDQFSRHVPEVACGLRATSWLVPVVNYSTLHVPSQSDIKMESLKTDGRIDYSRVRAACNDRCG